MNLFSELYNCYYQAVARILEEASDKPINRQQITKLTEAYGYRESMFSILPHLIEGDWHLLYSDIPPGTSYRSRLKHLPYFPLTGLQKSWLKALLYDKRISLFFTDRQLIQLKKALHDTEPLYNPEDFCYFDCYHDSDPVHSVMYQEHFQKLLQAIHHQQPLKIRYLSVKNRLIQQTYLPSHLEYSLKDGKFRLCALLMRKNKICRLDVLNIGRILCLAESGQPLTEPVDINPYLKNALCKEPVVLEITNQRNALERTMLHFASYQKIVEKQEENETYRCSIYYDPHWETELVIQILSFGPVIKVLGPENFLRQIKERVARQPEKHCDNEKSHFSTGTRNTE